MNHERLAMEFNLSAQDLKGAKGELCVLVSDIICGFRVQNLEGLTIIG